jgi:hypothetical protein
VRHVRAGVQAHQRQAAVLHKEFRWPKMLSQKQERKTVQKKMPLNKIRKIRLGPYDKKWSKKAREEKPYCEYCKATEFLNAHHYKGRSCKATRLMLENAVILCSKHHVFSSKFSAHKTPEKFKRWFKKEFPERRKQIIIKAQSMMSERAAIQEWKDLYES